MRKRIRPYRRLRNGIWKERGQFDFVYAQEQQKQVGIEYQHYGVSADNKLVFAGVTRHDHLNQAIANQVFRVWARWRREYDAQRPSEDYPAKHAPAVVTLTMFPVNNPEMAQTFVVEVQS